MSDIFLF